MMVTSVFSEWVDDYLDYYSTKAQTLQATKTTIYQIDF